MTSEFADPTVAPRVLVFFDYACPFCYLDWPRLKRLREEHDADLFLVPYELRPQIPVEGVPIEDIAAPHSERVEQHMLHMAREAELELTFPTFMPNTHLALGLGEYSRDVGLEEHELVQEAIFAAYNGRARDIGDLGVLLQIAESAGLNARDVGVALAESRFDERLHQFRHLALSLGISATPSALICNELLIGSRPYEVLAQALERCLVDERGIEERAIDVADGEGLGASVAQPEEGVPPSIVR